MNAGSAALRLLARRKFVGFWRRQARRLRTPKGALLALLGASVFALWFGSLLVNATVRTGVEQLETLELLATGALAVVTVLTCTNAFSFRGLYLQQSEIEALFSAPVSRADLIRYRLTSGLARSLFGAAFFGWMFARRAPVPGFAFVGACAAMLTLPLIGQALSLVLGDAENRLASRLAKLPWRGISLLATIALVAGAIGFVRAGSLESYEGRPLHELAAAVFEHPLGRAVRVPFTPWVSSITALTHAQFWPWFGLCVSVFALLWLGVPRIGIDFRELSLETSADVARRLARARRGMAANAGSASARTRGWRTPWLAGRGPFGAVAWRKAVSIVRKARASFVVGGLIVALVALLSVTLFSRGRGDALSAGLIVAGFGTFYLCLGLRFDFREDLDLLGVLRSWPIAPWKLFLATLLPETVLVSSMIALGVAAVTVYCGDPDPRLVLVVGAVPFFVLAWTAIDNATFLFAPVRAGAGQEGALQNAGRALVLMLLRSFVLGVSAGIAALPALVAIYVLEMSDASALVVGAGGGLLLVLAEIGVLVWIGGEVLRRFDVVRDQG